MFKARISWLEEPGNADLVRSGLRGLEKESLRIDMAGRLSTRPHPAALGSALTHTSITTDFSEALPELVTPPVSTVADSRQCLQDLHVFVQKRLDAEMLWPASMPSRIGQGEQIPIAEYGSSNAGRMKNVYRRGLGHRYGRTMQAIAGVHFNYSPPALFWSAYRAHEGAVEGDTQFRSNRLMALARNYRRHAWVVTYLFGASPAFDKSFRPEGHDMLESLDAETWYAPYATSLRMSDLGYRNSTQARLCICLNSLDDYMGGLREALMTIEPNYEAIGIKVDGEYRQLNANVLQIENEHYSSIRPKPGKRSELRPIIALRQNGVEYVEARNLDVNPEEPTGVSAEQMLFLEALLVFCLLDDSPPIGSDEQREIDARGLTVARKGRQAGLELPFHGRDMALREQGLELLERIGLVAELLDGDFDGYASAVRAQSEAFNHPDATLSGRMLETLRSTRTGFFEHVLECATRYARYFDGLELAAERNAELDAAVRESLLSQRRLENSDGLSFDRFLARYLSRT